MALGMIILVMGNWISLSRWDVLAFEIYGAATGITVLAYVVLSQTLPLAIEINERSISMIKRWRVETAQGLNRSMYCKRVVKSQKPLAILYGCTKFEKSTKRNYYSWIFTYTVNMLLLY